MQDAGIGNLNPRPDKNQLAVAVASPKFKFGCFSALQRHVTPLPGAIENPDAAAVASTSGNRRRPERHIARAGPFNRRNSVEGPFDNRKRLATDGYEMSMLGGSRLEALRRFIANLHRRGRRHKTGAASDLGGEERAAHPHMVRVESEKEPNQVSDAGRERGEIASNRDLMTSWRSCSFVIPEPVSRGGRCCEGPEFWRQAHYGRKEVVRVL